MFSFFLKTLTYFFMAWWKGLTDWGVRLGQYVTQVPPEFILSREQYAAAREAYLSNKVAAEAFSCELREAFSKLLTESTPEFLQFVRGVPAYHTPSITESTVMRIFAASNGPKADLAREALLQYEVYCEKIYMVKWVAFVKLGLFQNDPFAEFSKGVRLMIPGSQIDEYAHKQLTILEGKESILPNHFWLWLGLTIVVGVGLALGARSLYQYVKTHTQTEHIVTDLTSTKVSNQNPMTEPLNDSEITKPDVNSDRGSKPKTKKTEDWRDRFRRNPPSSGMSIPTKNFFTSVSSRNAFSNRNCASKFIISLGLVSFCFMCYGIDIELIIQSHVFLSLYGLIN